MDLNKLLKERGIELKYIESSAYRKGNLPELEIITNDDGFTKSLLNSAGFERFYTVSVASVEAADQMAQEIGKTENEILGIGGGKAIDVAKRVSMILERPYITFPTAPSHDGLVSMNYSLYNGVKRNSTPAKYPRKLVIPLHLWEKSGNLKKAGICDILSNRVALQDISLTSKPNELAESELKYFEMSQAAVDKVIYMENDKDLAEALILSGIAMEKGSQYCSGSEHEVERLLERKMNGRYFHGQLAGTGTLISSKAYELYSSQLPGDLYIVPGKIYESVCEIMKKNEVFDFALQPLRDSDFNPDWLKGVSAERPERYTLWNVVDSEKVDWRSVIEDILKTQ